MDNWIAPKDSPIWRSLNDSHPNLELPVKQRVFVLLQDSAIPPTDKIFPWIVETMINRVAMERLGDELGAAQERWEGLPGQVKQAVERSLSVPILAIQSNQATVEKLTVELRKNSVIEASVQASGWRGVLGSLEAIAQHKMLGLTVGAIALLSALISGAVVWNLGAGDRQIMNANRQAIKRCYDKFALDTDGNGWFSCPGIQIPMN